MGVQQNVINFPQLPLSSPSLHFGTLSRALATIGPFDIVDRPGMRPAVLFAVISTRLTGPFFVGPCSFAYRYTVILYIYIILYKKMKIIRDFQGSGGAERVCTHQVLLSVPPCISASNCS